MAGAIASGLRVLELQLHPARPLGGRGLAAAGPAKRLTNRVSTYVRHTAAPHTVLCKSAEDTFASGFRALTLYKRIELIALQLVM
jgi:hypothetical protein